MTLKPTDFESKYGINFERLDKEIKRRHQIYSVSIILGNVLKLIFAFGLIFLGIYIYNQIF